MNKPDLQYEYGKIPPQALDLEEAVLGALLIDPESTDSVLTLLPEGSFYKEANNIIYSAIKTIYGSGGQVDILTITEHLRKKEQLEGIGGAVYIAKLTSRVGTGLGAVEHAMIILQKYVLREAIRIASDLSTKAFDGGADPEDMISELFSAVNDLQAILLSNQRGATLKEALNLSVEKYFERVKMRQTGHTLGVKTPLPSLDKKTNGWQNADLVIVAARPSMGKTAFAISSATQAAKNGRAAVIFSIEMTTEKLADRIVIGEGHLDPNQYRAGTMSSHDQQLAEKIIDDLDHLQVYIDDSPRQTVADIWGKCRILVNKKQCDFVIIDYVGLIGASKERGKSREQEVAEISASLKMMAKDLNIPVMVLSQLNRGVEMRKDKRPNLADLRESGSLEQDSDVVIMLYRDEYYNPGQSEGIGEAIITKNRNGPCGMIEFNYNTSLTRIWEDEGRPFPIV